MDKKTDDLLNSGFALVGYGWFDLSKEETARVLELLELKKDRLKKLKEYYEALCGTHL